MGRAPVTPERDDDLAVWVAWAVDGARDAEADRQRQQIDDAKDYAENEYWHD